MTGIVERLRNISRGDHERGCQGREYICSCDYDETSWKTAEEAADEIERLRAGIKRLSDEEEKLTETTDGEEFSLVSIAAQLAAAESELDRLRRELEEARRALEQVCKDAKRVDVYQNGAPLDLVQPYLIDAARAALRAGEEGK